jgi:parvulin-like peptidyl-prolyl isomerase
MDSVGGGSGVGGGAAVGAHAAGAANAVAPSGAAGPAAAAGAAAPDLDAALAMVQGLPDDMGDGVSAAEERLRELHQGRQDVQRDLKNQRKKQKRLFEKAKNLSDSQLLTIISSRAAAKAKAVAKAKGKVKAKAKAKSQAVHCVPWGGLKRQAGRSS